MRHALPLVALVAALMTFGGCDGDECVDTDEDGFGVGPGCEAADCDDGNALHHADCLSCSDPDNDGYGVGCDLGFDCDPSNGRHWADCGKCTDGDLDGAGAGCDLGVDCDENDPDQFSADCKGCTDADGDGNYVGCDRYVNRPGPDCDDADGDNYLRCGYCADGDGDGRFIGCDRYVAHDGPDCDDFDINNWASCGICRDADADGYSVGCDAYSGDLKGPDCNDGSGLHWSDCGQCSDADGDGRGTGCNLGADCSDANRDAWVSCGSCADNDGDNRWAACDQYSIHQGPDCNDNDPNAYSKCATCLDADSDGYWTGCDVYTIAKPGQDCNDVNNNVWYSCGTCRDQDTDTYYVGCDAYASISGPDCGDFDRNNWGQCSTCLDTDNDGRYAACDAYTTISGPDCAPGDNEHWSDCGACVDSDGDGRGNACDLGPDCNDNSDQHWSDCATCTDLDDDGYGVGTCDVGSGDCDDNNNLRNPGASDLTVNGVDENCNGIDGPGFADTFEDGNYAPEWPTFLGDTFIQTTYRRTGSYALNLGGGGAEVQSTFFDTTACTAGIAWRYYLKRGYESPDSGENLYFEYWNGSVWTIMDTVTGNSSDDVSFNARTGVISAAAAQYAQFRVRFREPVASGTCCDDYHIDDLVVGCAIDTDGDTIVDPYDCAPADNRHWNDCGVCVDGDGDGYGTSCDLGADCVSADNNSGVNPGATDLTVDGIDQNCNGFDGTLTSSPSNVTPVGITDNGGNAIACGTPGAAVSSIAVSGVGKLTDVDVTLNATHALGEDLDIWLQYTPATGTPVCVQLSTDNGLAANFTSTVFSDEGVTSITAGTSPFTGTYQPESPLTTLDGRARAGTYTLYVSDDTATNTGSLTSWSLTLTYY